jgi:hypothetical protein
MLAVSKRFLCNRPSARIDPIRLYKPAPVFSAKTCFRFDDEDDGGDDEDIYNKNKWFYRRQHPPIVAILNRLYEESPPSPKEDLVVWMKDHWGALIQMELVLVKGELNLRVFNRRIENSETEDLYDTISKQLIDCMRLEYVKHHLSARLGMFHQKKDLEYIDIPLAIYFR